MLWLPESPRWLLLSGAGPAAGAAALRRTKGSSGSEAGVAAEVDQILETMAASPTAVSQGTFGEAPSMHTRMLACKQPAAGSSMHASQQACQQADCSSMASVA
jgi:hypothetical protein